MTMASELTVGRIQELYALYDDDVQAREIQEPITLTALSMVYKSERYLTEQYESAAWNTVKAFVDEGIYDKATMQAMAKETQEKDPAADEFLYEVFTTYLKGESVRNSVKRRILREFSSVFSLEGFYASHGIC